MLRENLEFRILPQIFIKMKFVHFILANAEGNHFRILPQNKKRGATRHSAAISQRKYFATKMNCQNCQNCQNITDPKNFCIAARKWPKNCKNCVLSQPGFLGLRGPLKNAFIPSFVRPFFRKKNLNYLLSLINHPGTIPDPSYEISP